VHDLADVREDRFGEVGGLGDIGVDGGILLHEAEN
jgi:hypothetical protein